MKRKVFLLLMILVSVCVKVNASEPDSLLVLDYRWDCSGEERTCTLSVDPTLLDYYRNDREHLSYRFDDTPFDGPYNYFSFMFSVYDRGMIRELTAQLCDSLASNQEKIQSALTFVQAIPYAYDGNSLGQDEYVRYPIETLVDREGDCEDKVSLLGAMLNEMEVDFVLLVMPEHLALGVRCDSVRGRQALMVDGEPYYYVETTTEHWEIGMIPEDFANTKIQVVQWEDVPIVVSKEMKFQSQPALVTSKAACSLSVHLQNWGPGSATGLRVLVRMVASSHGKKEALAEETFVLEDLGEGESRVEQLDFKSYIRKGMSLWVKLSGDGLPDQVFEMRLQGGH